jgi:hypothetical protein
MGSWFVRIFRYTWRILFTIQIRFKAIKLSPKVRECNRADLFSKKICPGFPFLQVSVRKTFSSKRESWVEVAGRTEVLAPLRILFGFSRL